MAKKQYKYTRRTPATPASIEKKKHVDNLVLSSLQKRRKNYSLASKRLEHLIIEFNKRVKQKPFSVVKKTISFWIHGD
jgi:hypothetical protein